MLGGSLAQPHRKPLATRVFQGTVLAIVATAFQLAVYGATGLSARQITVGLAASAVAGGLAGVAYYATDGFRASGGWRRTAANVLTLLGFCGLAFVLVMVLF